MKSSVEFRDENGHVQLDLALSIGGTFRSLPEKSTASGSSFTLFSDGDEEESGVNDAAKDRGEIQAKRNREDDDEDERNPPLKREKKLQGVGSECNVDREDSRNKPPVLMPYPFSSSLQYVPFFNGFAFPYVVPYWAVGHGGERTVIQPVACRSFTPFEANRKTGSSGSSPVCSSSVVSDNNQSSSSHEGGGSSYTRSNSCNSSSDRHQTVSPNPNANDSMNHVKPKLCSENKTQCGEKFVESQVSKTTTIKKESIMASNKEEAMVPTSKSVKCSMKNMMKMENGKPPKPQILQSRNVAMPCVSTTGVGPDGKTITGFLYRYSNLEVSILCVCHGESFSPAEFVKHAGGGDVSNPLRHITVLPTNGIPSAIR